MAIDTSNLGPTSRALRRRYPDAQMAMAADNDAHLPLRPEPRALPNAGMKKAAEVAVEIGAPVVAPKAVEARTKADKGTDWNDYRTQYGVQATRAALRVQLAAEAVEKNEAVIRPPSIRPT
jgi:phage/plasmid primase-like uncharacterized protein